MGLHPLRPRPAWAFQLSKGTYLCPRASSDPMSSSFLPCTNVPQCPADPPPHLESGAGLFCQCPPLLPPTSAWVSWRHSWLPTGSRNTLQRLQRDQPSPSLPAAAAGQTRGQGWAAPGSNPRCTVPQRESVPWGLKGTGPSVRGGQPVPILLAHKKSGAALPAGAPPSSLWSPGKSQQSDLLFFRPLSFSPPPRC